MQKQVRIDESLEIELKKIQAKMKQLIGNVDLSQNQASKIAAKILRDKSTNIKVEITKARKGNRGNVTGFL